MKIEIENDINGYGDILCSAIKIKNSRQKQYGDGWKDNKNYHNLAMIAEKFRRLEHLIINNKKQHYEKIEDTIVDLINWSAFLGANVMRQKNGNK